MVFKEEFSPECTEISKKKCFCVHILVVMLWLLKVLKPFLLQVNTLPVAVGSFPLLSCPQKSAYSKT